MTPYFFTFGTGQKNAEKYVEIHAETFMKARTAMYNKYSEKWLFQYEKLEEVHVDDRHLLEVIKAEED